MADLLSRNSEAFPAHTVDRVSDISRVAQNNQTSINGRPFNGGFVIPANHEFNLTDAAEELSFAFAEKTESRTVKERSISTHQKPKVPPQQEVEKLFRSMQDERAARDLKQIAGRLITLLREGKSPRQFLEERFSDPLKRYLAIAYAIEEIKQRDGTPAEIERLHDLLAETEARDGASIRAGINTMDMAAEFGATAADGDKFRKVYRDAVIGYESFAATLDSVLTQFGDTQFDNGVRLLLKGLSVDMNATAPSLDPARLHAILQDLFNLEAVTTVMQRCRQMVDRLDRAGLVKALNPIALARDLLQITAEPYVTAYHFADLARKYDVRDEDPQVALFSGAMGAIRGMPPKVFRTEEMRLKAIEAAQAALDAILLNEQ
jgi:type III secretion protein W